MRAGNCHIHQCANISRVERTCSRSALELSYEKFFRGCINSLIIIVNDIQISVKHYIDGINLICCLINTNTIKNNQRDLAAGRREKQTAFPFLMYSVYYLYK